MRSGESLRERATGAEQEEREPEQPERSWGEQPKRRLFRAFEGFCWPVVGVAEFDAEPLREQRPACGGEGNGDEVARQEREQEVAVEVAWRGGEGEREVLELGEVWIGAKGCRNTERTKPEEGGGGGEAEECLAGGEPEPAEAVGRLVSRLG